MWRNKQSVHLLQEVKAAMKTLSERTDSDLLSTNKNRAAGSFIKQPSFYRNDTRLPETETNVYFWLPNAPRFSDAAQAGLLVDHETTSTIWYRLLCFLCVFP